MAKDMDPADQMDRHRGNTHHRMDSTGPKDLMEAHSIRRQMDNTGKLDLHQISKNPLAITDQPVLSFLALYPSRMGNLPTMDHLTDNITIAPVKMDS